jgi:hypothetical protein
LECPASAGSRGLQRPHGRGNRGISGRKIDMAVTTFAAIDIGSYNVSMEIFEITKKNGLRSLTTVRQSMELGRDTYTKRRITSNSLKELTAILRDYSRIMKEYGVTAYRACAKSAFREARNLQLVQEHIRNKTGISVEVLSNAEQRFLGYKALASRGEQFERTIFIAVIKPVRKYRPDILYFAFVFDMIFGFDKGGKKFMHKR